MPADASIYGQIQPTQQPNRLEQLARAMQVQGLQDQGALAQYGLKKAQREDEDNAGLRADLSGGMNPIQALLNRGRVKEAGDYQTQQTAAGEKKAQMNGHQFKLMGELTNTIAADPRPETVAGVLDQWEGLTGLKADPTRQAFARLQTPEQIREMALRLNLQAKDQLPKTETRNTGGTTDTLAIDPLTGKPTVTGSVKNTATPGDLLSSQDRRASLRQSEDHFQKTQSNAGNTYDAERGVVVNTRTNTAQPVLSGGIPLGAKDKALTEGQAKANLFGTRMQESDKVIAAMAKAGVLQPGGTKRTAEALGNIVGLGTDSMGGALSDAAGSLTNWTQSSEQQQVEQAQRDFINADLRRESGASIAPHEFRNAKQQYFPQPGDSDEVLAQKARNRQLATQGILAEVPENKRTKPPAVEATAFSDPAKEARYLAWKRSQEGK